MSSKYLSSMKSFKEIIKEARLQKGLLAREVATHLGIDQAIISKFESGSRKPSREQVQELANLFSIPEKKLVLAWLTEKIVYDLQEDEYGLEALKLAEDVVAYQTKAINIYYLKSLYQ